MRFFFVILILSFVLCCKAQKEIDISEINCLTIEVKDSLRIPKIKKWYYEADSCGTKSTIYYFSKKDSARSNYIANPSKVFDEKYFDTLRVISFQKVARIIQGKHHFDKIEEVTLNLAKNYWMIISPEKSRLKIFIPGNWRARRKMDWILKEHATIYFHGRQFKRYYAYIDAKTGEIKKISKSKRFRGRRKPHGRHVNY